MEQYWSCVHPISRTVHRPSFERSYYSFWAGRRTPKSTQALIFATMFSAAVSMPKDHPILPQLHDNTGTLLKKLQSSAETLLGLAHLARATKLETIQAAVTYLVRKALSSSCNEICYCFCDADATLNHREDHFYQITYLISIISIDFDSTQLYMPILTASGTALSRRYWPGSCNCCCVHCPNSSVYQSS